MTIHIRPLLISLFILSASVSLHADAQGDAAAEQRRQDEQRQEQKIQDSKLQDQYYDNRRQEQQIIDRKMEDRRAEQRRLDNARQRLSAGGETAGSEIADRGRGARDRRNNLRDDQDLMDDTIDERMLERNQLRQNLDPQQGGNPYQPQQGCSGPGCQAGAQGCQGFNCQDPQALHRMEASQKCYEENYEHHKAIVEQWDRDHPLD